MPRRIPASCRCARSLILIGNVRILSVLDPAPTELLNLTLGGQQSANRGGKSSKPSHQLLQVYAMSAALANAARRAPDRNRAHATLHAFSRKSSEGRGVHSAAKSHPCFIAYL
jgi:hypothetical protein